MEITYLGVQKQIVSFHYALIFKHKELEMTNHNIFWPNSVIWLWIKWGLIPMVVEAQVKQYKESTWQCRR